MASINVLYVTSFSPDLYQATGRHLLRSYLESDSDGRMLICHEQGMAGEFRGLGGQFLVDDLDKSQLLSQWLKANRDIIPSYLGGDAGPCHCVGNDHATGCASSWFNRNASRWFRKIVSLDQAIQIADVDIIIWLDSDCRFKRKLTTKEILDFFGEHAIFYLKSKDRTVMESGIVGFYLNRGGRDFIEITTRRYRSGEFRNYERWDDGYQFQVTVERHPEIMAVDLATHMSGYDDVVPNSPLGVYFNHFKGVHGPVLHLMH